MNHKVDYLFLNNLTKLKNQAQKLMIFLKEGQL